MASKASQMSDATTMNATSQKSGAIMVKKEVLDNYQKKLLELVAKDDYIRTNFYFTGGTALAEFYLRHRRSYDLDFFAEKPFEFRDVANFANQAAKKLQAKNVVHNHIHDRHEFIFEFGKGETVKIEFVWYQFAPLQKPRKIAGLMVDSLKDMAANKLFATVERNEPKDLVDLGFILQEKFTLKTLRMAVQQKFGMKLGTWHYPELFKRGVQMEYIKVDLLREPKIDFHEFYKEQLRSTGARIFIP